MRTLCALLLVGTAAGCADGTSSVSSHETVAAAPLRISSIRRRTSPSVAVFTGACPRPSMRSRAKRARSRADSRLAASTAAANRFILGMRQR